MRELRRIFSGPRRVLALALILIINVGLFVRQQEEDNFGFSGKVDGARALEYYNELFDKYGGLDPETALEEVDYYAKMEERFDDILTDLYQLDIYYRHYAGDPYTTWYVVYQSDYNKKKEEFPELVEAVSAGTVPDDETLAIQTAGAEKLMDQLQHILSYESYPDTVDANSRRMARFSIFSKPGSFSARNNQKTAEDFASMRGTQVTLGRDQAVTALFSFKLTDWLLVLIMVLTAVSFLEERQDGLWNTVYASPDGRGRLALKRVAILLVTALVSSLLLYGSTLLAGFYLYGGEDALGRAAQSLEIFKPLALRVSVGGVLVRALILRAVTAFLVGLVMWLMLSAANTSVRWMLAASAAFFAAEYSLYTALPYEGPVGILKYVNILSLIDISPLYTSYLNLNIFGTPVNIRDVTAALCPPLALILGGGCCLAEAKMRPRFARTPLAGVGKLINRGLDSLRSHLKLTGFECYKLLAAQGGALILLAFVYILSGADYQVHISRSEADDLAAQLQGEITDSTLEALETRDREIDEVFAISEKYQNMVNKGSMDFDTLYDFNLKYSNTQAEQVGLHSVMAKVDGLLEKGEDLGVKLWLLDEVPFRNIYGSEADGARLTWNLITLLSLALLLAGFMAMERTSPGLRQVTRASSRGRGPLLRRKFAVSAAVVLILWAVPTYFELRALLTAVDTAVLAAPLQSLTFLGDFPLSVSIGAFLAGLYAARLLALLSCAALALWLSSLFRRPQLAYLAVLGVLAAPTAISNYLDVPLLRPVSAARAIDPAALLASSSGGISPALLPLAVLIILGAASAALTCRRWGRTP